MSTQSTIAVTLPDNKVRAVYCHHDGYPSWNGKILLSHINSRELAEKLVAGGDMSGLSRLGEAQYYNDGSDSVVISRNELLNFARTSCGAEYVYLFDDGWKIARPSGSFVVLTESMTKED